MPSQSKPLKQILILIVLFILALLISLFIARQLKNKTAATPDEIAAYQLGKQDLESLKLKIEAYRDANDNTLPDSLSELAPDFISESPRDPYGNQYNYDKWKSGGVALLSFWGRDGQKGGFGINKDYTIRLKVLKVKD